MTKKVRSPLPTVHSGVQANSISHLPSMLQRLNSRWVQRSLGLPPSSQSPLYRAEAHHRCGRPGILGPQQPYPSSFSVWKFSPGEAHFGDQSLPPPPLCCKAGVCRQEKWETACLQLCSTPQKCCPGRVAHPKDRELSPEEQTSFETEGGGSSSQTMEILGGKQLKVAP